MLLIDWQRIEEITRWARLTTDSFAVSVELPCAENLYQTKHGDGAMLRLVITNTHFDEMAINTCTAKKLWQVKGFVCYNI